MLGLRLNDLENRDGAAVTLDWIRRRRSAIRESMLATPAKTMADVGAKHRAATAGGVTACDDELLESAEDDVVRLVYG